jgi:hypothetical protein
MQRKAYAQVGEYWLISRIALDQRVGWAVMQNAQPSTRHRQHNKNKFSNIKLH